MKLSKGLFTLSYSEGELSLETGSVPIFQIKIHHYVWYDKYNEI